MTAPHQDSRVEDVVREGAEALAEVATAALPGFVRVFVKRDKLARAIESGVRDLLARIGVVTGKVIVTGAPGVPVNVRVRR